MNENRSQPCPACENKAQLVTMNLTPELVEEMALSDKVSDPVLDSVYQERLNSCKNCPKLLGGMTCAFCGCFVQFRARHKTAHCPISKW